MVDEAEFVSGKQVKTALVNVVGAGLKSMLYAEIDGRARVEGCIDLGPVDQVDKETTENRAKALAAAAGLEGLGIGITGLRARWPNKTVPFTIDPNLPNRERVIDAIAHWHAKTEIKFVARTTEADFVTFRPGSGCSSSVGRQGRQQFVTLGPDCTMGNCIHEIGHTVGLWHEQSRHDRDQFVRVRLENVISGMEHNFSQHLNDGVDLDAYNYGSIMHYPTTAFSVDGLQPTIEPLQDSAQIGQRVGLNEGDIKAVELLYP